MVELNDGILKIYAKVSVKVQGKSIEKLTYVKDAWYGEISFMTDEYYSALRSDVKVEKRIRIHQDKTISSKNIIIIDDRQYQVGRTFSTVNNDGLPITDITLEEAGHTYDML